ncbi:DUF1549 and DUF1553 domain-containing protein [Anatilimnocola floriformis]|uniref:DUF1549 and DUF1553 domain-containing protein n=1 Tax=Anatilimnocola floriformis TaxID=2948575 RepID=UPI0020C35C68|nr:DUF1549 and DUF1553 domain-containing protein [Anatilimnocola floriformis]
MSKNLALSLLALSLLATSASAQQKFTALQVYPPDVHLSTKQDLQRFVVVATREDGVTLEVTNQSSIKLADDKLCRMDKNTLYPVADGNTMLNVEYQGLSTSATVEVKNATADRGISFQLDVMPVFMRGGCNTGSCHGAARGKDGFRLSLFGFDPQGDYYRITREMTTRRINLASPADSLLVEKSIGSVPHTGGKRFAGDSEHNLTLLRWLEAGAPNDAAPTPAVLGVDLYPPSAVLEGEGATQQFIARARYADGTDRDITSLATFMTNNDNSAPITPDGLVTASNRGEAFIMVRFETHTVGNQVLVLPKDLKYTAPAVEGNYVDQLVGEKLKKVRILPSGVCTDEQFIRRVSLDITGSLPKEEDFLAFMADGDPGKRAKLIDKLLDRKEFSEIWAMKWSELLMIKSSNQVSYKSMFLYSNWLTDQVANDVPLDKMVQDLLSASGGTFKSPGTNFYQIERDTLKTAENVAQVFFGIRTQCAQCHNHPFDRWTMDDYYSFAAFFAQIGRKQSEDYREIIVFNSGGGEVKHPVNGKNMAPKFLGGIEADVKGKDRRAVLAQWMTSPENPFFATSVANRVWSHFFGKGIVEPVDDIRVSNPASNPELFQQLGKKLIEYKYDFKQLVRDICNSQAYQRSVERNESNMADLRNFAHGNVRRIPAEMLLDCISQVTDAKDKFQGLPLGARATQIADGKTSNYFLTTFGRSPRETVCAGDAKTDPTLSQALHMINGQTIQGKIAAGGLTRKMLAEKKTPEQIIESLYIRCLSRKPTPEESQRLLTTVSQSENPQAGLDDVFWAIMNSREFLFNH